MSLADREVVQDAEGFVLAGGRSSRMGSDKALVQLDGKPLVAYALDLLREAGIRASIAGARSPLDTFSLVLEDVQPDRGPLEGICAALAYSSARWVVLLPVDLPLLPASLVGFLLNHSRTTGVPVTLASVNGFAQTFPAILDRAVHSTLRAELEAGRRGCYAGFQAAANSLGQAVAVLAVEAFVQCGQVRHPDALPAARWFLNVNRPADLKCAKGLLRARHRVS